MANRGKPLDKHVFSLQDLKDVASKKLPKVYREYFNLGAMDLITLHDNEAAFDRYKIRPRILRNVSTIDTSTTFCETKVSFPFGFSPAAAHKVAHPDGEIGTSRAAATTGIPMGLSSYANTTLEDVVAQGSGNPYIIQVNFLMNKDIMRDVLSRAEAVFLTVDAPVYGHRLNEARNEYSLPDDLTYPNMVSGQIDLAGDDDPLAYDPSINWEEAISFMRRSTNLPIWLKGVYTPEDVVLAIDHGFDGILISNHGGRQLDSVPATIDALRECAPVAKGKIPIGIDGGIRRGTDIFKALALGADFCFAGRIPIWGLAYNGTKGVELAIRLLHKELKMVMGLAGCKSIRDITPAHLSVLDCKGGLSKL
ncbi:hypothetical protein ASPWEDRAFT_698631 [Aspergillus wentii DTO 134E9]|uniref:Oxidase FUB9 n=1 Tax=Aspergillus wentii DTO 134E9 TaxID=1073089 RepID=A0A1L9R9N7_ASPWE|nr:uncharacterized protein ASPWEDRAFT_698631 [Aspergillus wentii DTO 134E9]OJJ31645.1 hypothetical protein ASPWEDRAFT_698631 [Aspergillus wentii DTO 134E9]